MYQNTNNHESVYFYEHPTDALLYDIILLSVWAVIENAMYGSPPVTPASIPFITTLLLHRHSISPTHFHPISNSFTPFITIMVTV
mmetsp:Transcript_19537/g.28107  ORF Transcript_19537/g.28107 Transcript_19537/m.28107 type:complete len:85 (-) Transcript_19537:22-276(-)